MIDGSDSLDPLFREAVTAIDAGDTAALERLISKHPRLLRDRLDNPGAWLRDLVGGALDGFFQQPFLLWFVAEDTVHNGTLPRKIGQATHTNIQAALQDGGDSLPQNIDYDRILASWFRVAC